MDGWMCAADEIVSRVEEFEARVRSLFVSLQ